MIVVTLLGGRIISYC